MGWERVNGLLRQSFPAPQNQTDHFQEPPRNYTFILSHSNQPHSLGLTDGEIFRPLAFQLWSYFRGTGQPSLSLISFSSLCTVS